MDEEDTDVVRTVGDNLAALFRSAGITRDFVRRMTERGDDLWSPLTPTREAIYSDNPAAVLLRLFICGCEVDASEVPAAARECGLLDESGDGKLRSPLHLRLVRNLYLFSDYLGRGADAAMGAGETTAILYRASRPQRRVKRVLDLGCGAGTLALLLSAEAETVTGTDINPRAVEMARLNARVNGITNAEFLAGDLFEPLKGKRFDLIVSQPPYYPNGAGGSGLTFLHAGARGDEIALRVMTGIPAHLEEQGRALVFTSWPIDRAPVSLPDHDVLELFANRQELDGTRQSLDVVRSGIGWSARFEVPADSWGAVDPDRIEAVFAGEDLLRGSEEAFLAARLRLTPGVRVFEEGQQRVLRGEPESLVGCAEINDDVWATMQAVDRAATAGSAGLSREELMLLKDAIRRGWMSVAKLDTTTERA